MKQLLVGRLQAPCIRSATAELGRDSTHRSTALPLASALVSHRLLALIVAASNSANAQSRPDQDGDAAPSSAPASPPSKGGRSFMEMLRHSTQQALTGKKQIWAYWQQRPGSSDARFFCLMDP